LKWILTGILGPLVERLDPWTASDIIANILRQKSALKLCIIKYMYKPNDCTSELNKALNIYTIVYSHHHA